MNFKLDKEDFEILEVMLTICRDSECSDRQYNRILKFAKKLNSQIPEPVTTTTRRIKVFK